MLGKSLLWDRRRNYELESQNYMIHVHYYFSVITLTYYHIIITFKSPNVDVSSF